MRWILPTAGMTLGGWIGWALGAHFGIMIAFFLSVVGSAVGLYVMRKLMRDLF